MANRTCSIDGCEKPTGPKGTARGWCSKHYNRWYRWGDPHSLAPKPTRPDACTDPGCEKPYKTAGYCSAHYTNVLRHGEPNPRKRGEVRDGCKICTACKQDLPVERFGPMRANVVPPRCRECERASAERKRRADPAAARRYARDYSTRNPEKRRDYAKRRRAMKLSQGGDTEAIESLVVMLRDRWTCGICGTRVLKSRQWPDRLSPSVDHIVPLALGGTHSYANVQAAHLGCNMAKGGRRRN